jgi:hypothetical protein
MVNTIFSMLMDQKYVEFVIESEQKQIIKSEK